MDHHQATSDGEDERERPAASTCCRNCGSPWHGSRACRRAPAAGGSSCDQDPDAGCPSCRRQHFPWCGHEPNYGPAVPAAGSGDPGPQNQHLDPRPAAGDQDRGCNPGCPCNRWRGGARLDDEPVAVAPVSGGSGGNAWPR